MRTGWQNDENVILKSPKVAPGRQLIRDQDGGRRRRQTIGITDQERRKTIETLRIVTIISTAIEKRTSWIGELTLQQIQWRELPTNEQDCRPRFDDVSSTGSDPTAGHHVPFRDGR